ncbi:MAG: GIY-YIG nuclease family protein [Gammaproteobacteria bacterium]
MDDIFYWVYILACDNGSYYTGYTVDLAKRYKLHLEGKACKYTRSFKPIALAQCWKVMGEKKIAMQVERDIKKLSRANKEKIIAEPLALTIDPRIVHVPNIKFQ